MDKTTLLFNLKKLSRELRSEVIDIAASEVGCHLGGSLSVIDVMNTCFHSFEFEKEDLFILSKGHCAAALYACLYHYGFVQEKPSLNYGKNDSLLLGHPNHKIPGVSFATGSLGHGLPLAIGWSIGQRLLGKSGIAVAVLGDGEIQEGLVWESLQIAQAQKVSNLCIIIDSNGYQNDGEVASISPICNITDRFRSFGCEVIEIDGHCHNEILSGIELAKKSQKPFVVIAKTLKAKGFSTLESMNGCHYMKISDDEASSLKKELSYE